MHNFHQLLPLRVGANAVRKKYSGPARHARNSCKPNARELKSMNIRPNIEYVEFPANYHVMYQNAIIN